MLIKITNHCSMGCSHCMEDSTVAGKHMSLDTFYDVLKGCFHLESKAWAIPGVPKHILLSGGECTEHPEFEEFVKMALRAKTNPIILTNGSWLSDPEKRKSILRPEWKDVFIQVTHDPEFYPQPIGEVPNQPNIAFVPKLTVMLTLGRYKGKSSIPDRTSPTSFNLRSLTRSHGDIRTAIATMRARAAMGMSGHCSPSVSEDGTVTAGESRNCYPIGKITDDAEKLTQALLNMGECNRCGLESNLDQMHRRAIGLSSLYLGTEP